MAPDPALEVLARHNAGDEGYAFGVEDLAQQPVVTEPFTGGVGPAGCYLASLDAERQAELRERCHARLPSAPFVLTARAWAARGVA